MTHHRNKYKKNTVVVVELTFFLPALSSWIAACELRNQDVQRKQTRRNECLEQGSSGMFKLEHNMNSILTGSYLLWNGQTEWKFPIRVC